MKRYPYSSKIACGIMTMLLFVLVACSTMTITGQWQDMNYKGGPFKKYIVIGLFKKLTARQSMEDAITEALKKNGIDATSSLTVLTPDREINRNDKDLDNFLHVLGIDGILMVKMTGIQRSEKFVRGGSYYTQTPGVPFSGPYMTYYYNYYQPVRLPNYIEDFKSVILECSLFENGNNKLVWRAEARSVPYDKSSQEIIEQQKTAGDLAELIIKDLKKDGFIAARR